MLQLSSRHRVDIMHGIRDSGTNPIYGLPKIRKPDVPLTLIVSSIGSPNYQMFKYITFLISPPQDILVPI